MCPEPSSQVPPGAISAAAVQSSSNRWRCALLEHAPLPASRESREFSLPVEHPACTGGAGATEEEVSDRKGSRTPGTEGRGRFDGPGYFKQGRVRLRWKGAGGEDRPRSCMEEVPGFQVTLPQHWEESLKPFSVRTPQTLAGSYTLSRRRKSTGQLQSKAIPKDQTLPATGQRRPRGAGGPC